MLLSPARTTSPPTNPVETTAGRLFSEDETEAAAPWFAQVRSVAAHPLGLLFGFSASLAGAAICTASSVMALAKGGMPSIGMAIGFGVFPVAAAWTAYEIVDLMLSKRRPVIVREANAAHVAAVDYAAEIDVLNKQIADVRVTAVRYTRRQREAMFPAWRGVTLENGVYPLVIQSIEDGALTPAWSSDELHLLMLDAEWIGVDINAAKIAAANFAAAADVDSEARKEKEGFARATNSMVPAWAGDSTEAGGFVLSPLVFVDRLFGEYVAAVDVRGPDGSVERSTFRKLRSESIETAKGIAIAEAQKKAEGLR